ncbi:MULTISPECIES: DUF5363 family protein [Aeromonas]|uniref:DUF5363 family protein n=1 Tax=Aeromonas TaxID=642 RepID=UPI00164F3919|nr:MULTISPECIES: DUF5363 family protein [Aeromonas]ELB2790107.1 DUF5363 family protein [Aeromonas hydrophila]MBF4799405.1 hypothetical protein [Aeromonas hydrophila]MBO0407435.1 DUF5363 family protein [Aeromonas hydrophila]MCZ4334241.1 DUF5363 family protein [Aeromonas hydrophila]HDZ8913541.1 DUF5363 family protein [Aeromonas hydrophila]
MKGILLRWLARYDGWCEEWGLTPENRRCCVPVRHEQDDAPQMEQQGESESLTGNCGSRHQ